MGFIGTTAEFFRPEAELRVQEPTSSSLRVAVDGTSLLDHRTGVGVFVEELVTGLAHRSDIDLSVFAVSWRGRDRLGALVPPGVAVRTRPLPARVARAAWKRVDQPSARLVAGPADVVHGPNFVVPPGGGAAEVVTVHDLTALHFPEMCTADVLEWPDLLRRALRRGAWVHTVSAHVADEVREAFPEAGDRVVAVPNGVRPPVPADPADGRSLAGGDRYVLAVGTVEPRKDLPGLVAAFDLLADADPSLRLVVAGADGMAAGALADAIAAARHGDRVVRTGSVSDSQRAALLHGAAAVAYPSRYEGFGLVPLEAMAVGVPVVATAAGAVPEVVGDAAVLVPVADPTALAEGLGGLLGDEQRRADLVARGRERVRAFTWERTVEGIVALYRRAVEDA